MRMIQRRIALGLAVLLSFSMALNSISVFAHDQNEHNKELEEVLFGNDSARNDLTDKSQNALDAIEAAAYLALDQYNGNGKKQLDLLKKEGVHGIPKTIDEIDFGGNNYHRIYTHRGWNFNYSSDLAHWPVRKKLLLDTVNTKMKFGIMSNRWTGYSNKCDSFAALVYYVHVLGDHIEDEKYLASGPKIELAYPQSGEPGIVSELIKISEILFEDQADTLTYQAYIQKLYTIQIKAQSLVSKTGGITQERFEEYHSYSEDLMEVLKLYASVLLKEEDFFNKTFFQK